MFITGRKVESIQNSNLRIPDHLLTNSLPKKTHTEHKNEIRNSQILVV